MPNTAGRAPERPQLQIPCFRLAENPATGEARRTVGERRRTLGERRRTQANAGERGGALGAGLRLRGLVESADLADGVD